MEKVVLSRWNLILILILVLHSGILIAQPATPPLERIISITLREERLDHALSRVSREGDFEFSYSTSAIATDKIVSGEFVRRSVREILNTLLGESAKIKVKGNYIILTRNNIPAKPVSTIQLSGYVLNANTGEKISEVSVYEKTTRSSTVTNGFGYFSLKVNGDENESQIAVSKKDYRDTTLTLVKGTTQLINVALLPIPPPEDTVALEIVVNLDSLLVVVEEEKSLSPGQVNVENIKDTLYRTYQFSVLPFVGTNHKLSGNFINDYSVNLIGGFSQGTRKLEAGTVFNIDRGDVQYVQLAGLVNMVGGKVSGLQAAGGFNLTRRKVEAFQFAGLMNINGDSVYSGQFAGLMNVNLKASRGAQFAGLANVQVHDYVGVQFAPLFNIATHSIKGVQGAVLFNYAKHVRGSQLAFINIADTVEGVSIGFLNFVKSGYHQIEVSADEIFYLNMAFRTGVPNFYNIFTAGIKPDNFEVPYWTVGYGIGTAPRLARWLHLNFDFTVNQVSQGEFTPAINLLNKFYAGLEFKPAKKFAIGLGVTLNAYVTDTTYDGYVDLFTSYRPTIIYDETDINGINTKMWWGAKIGLRFL